MKHIFYFFLVFFVGTATYTHAQNAKEQLLEVYLSHPENLIFYAPETPELQVVVKMWEEALFRRKLT